MKANLFIVGAMKAATTQYYTTLTQSEYISGGEIKEPNYFAKNYIHLNNFSSKYLPYRHGIGSGNNHIGYLRREDEYSANFKEVTKDAKYILDSSVTYAEFPGIEKEIHKYNPQAKIIFCVRNPMLRAYSHFSMDKEIGRVNGLFIEEFYKDYRNTKKVWGKDSYYYECSIYFDKINRYISEFGKENVCVLLTDIDSVSKNCEILSQFLNVQINLPKESEANASIAPRFGKINVFLQALGIKSLLKEYVSASLKKRLKKIFYKSSVKLSSDDCKKIKGLFYDDVTKLESLIEREVKVAWGMDD